MEKKEIISIRKDNYMKIVDYFNPWSIYAQVDDEVFCLSPFIHFTQEAHETNAMICFFKQDKGGKYHFDVVSTSQDKEFDKDIIITMENQLKMLVT